MASEARSPWFHVLQCLRRTACACSACRTFRRMLSSRAITRFFAEIALQMWSPTVAGHLLVCASFAEWSGRPLLAQCIQACDQ
mmetsp:Transcript_30094/g.36921  ORF Transcript_30094/g.36921 Transcript_30094/m.36921 type:complete len:83 (+) Transcript_30094:1190-1438(+)